MEISDEIKLKELELKKIELELKKAEIQNQKSIWIKIFNPFSTSIIVAVIGGAYSLNNLNQQKEKELELSKLEYEQKLYLQAMTSNNIQQACEVIKFYNAVGQLDVNNKIELCESPSISINNQILDSIINPIANQKAEIAQKNIKVKIPLINSEGIAKQYEAEGFNSLMNNDIQSAIIAFEKAEQIYPSYHNVYEISKFLSNNKDKDINLLKKTIKEKYSWGAPKEIIDKY